MTRLELAEIMLDDAQWNLEGARYRSAISRAYYACYHAARACLEKIGIVVISREPHGATSNLFGSQLVLRGVLPQWMGEVLNDLAKDRIRADYRPDVVVDEKLARQVVTDAERFLKEVKDVWDRL